MLPMRTLYNPFILLMIAILAACQPAQQDIQQNEPQKPVSRIFYLQSYRYGHPLELPYTKTIEDSSRANRLKLTLYYLDARPTDSENLQLQRATEILNEIRIFAPEALIVAEDPAIERFITSYAPQLSMPIIMTGIDWSTENYEFESPTVATMVERPPVDSLFQQTGILPDSIHHVFVMGGLSKENLRAQKTLNQWATRHQKDVSYHWVTTQNEWEIAFQEGQHAGNLVLLLSEVGISNWDATRSAFTASQYLTEPTVGLTRSMIPCAAISYAPSQTKQATWAMEIALSVNKLRNTLPEQPHYAPYETWHYPTLCEKARIVLDSTWLQRTQQFILP